MLHYRYKKLVCPIIELIINNEKDFFMNFGYGQTKNTEKKNNS